MIPNNGPFAGGNTVLVTNAVPAIGNGADITNLTVGGVSATITAQGTNWAAFTAPATGSAGQKDIVIRSTSRGGKTLAGAYTVNPAGRIFGGGAAGGKKWQAAAEELVPKQVNARGANNTIYGLDYFGNNLYAGGSFTNIGGTNCFRVAQYDGTNWSSMGSGVVKIANVNCVKGANHGIYAGGYFTNIGSTNMLAGGRWDGTNWNAMGRVPAAGTAPENKRGLGFSAFVNGYINWMEPYTGSTVIAGGYFTNTDFRVGGVSYVAKFDGVGWTNMQEGFRNVVMGAAYDEVGDNLYVCGSFTNHYPTNTSVHMNYIARWDGTHWTNMSRGLGNRVTCMAVHPTSRELYIGGWFTNYFDSAGNQHRANRVAKWDPVTQSFTNLGSGLNNWVYTMKFAQDGTLYVGGMFTNTWISTEPNDTNAPQLSVSRIARWTGTHWTNVGGGFNNTVQTLAVNTNNGDLYAGGFFKIAYNEDSSTNCWFIAKWGDTGTEGPGVDPESGSWAGGYQVEITGENLGNGSDITNVTICGASASSILSQSATQVVVTAGASAFAVTGNVSVFSTSRGETVKSNVFEYVADTPAQAQVTGTNGAAIASGAAATEAAGGDFGRVPAGEARTNVFLFENTGNVPVRLAGVSTSGAGAAAFSCAAGLPVMLEPRESCELAVTFAPGAGGVYGAQLSFENSNPDGNPYLLNLAGSGWQLAPSSGPFAGGTAVVLTNGTLGNGADITSVKVGESAAAITGQGANWVAFTTPAASASGAQDVIVQSASLGVATFAGAFSYNANPPQFGLRGVNGAAITNNESAVADNGTDFGNVSANLSLTHVLTLANDGESALTISSWTTNGAGAAKFTISGLPASVAAGTASNITVVFAPGTAGAYSASLVAANNSGVSPFTVNLAGTGVPVSGGGQNVDVASGTFTTNSIAEPSPVNIWFRSAHGQMIYTAAELTTAGMASGAVISRIGFYVVSAPVSNMPGYMIRMKHTSDSSMTTTLDSTGLTTVYSNALYAPTPGGFDMLDLGAPFVWNGSDNVLVDWGFDMLGAYNQSGQTRQDAVVNGMAVLRSDTSDQRFNYADAVVTNARPQIRFTTEAVAAPVISLLGTNGATIANGEAASMAKGGDFGALAWGGALTNTFSITNAGGGTLTNSAWTTNGLGAGAFTVAGMPATVAAGSVSNFTVIFCPQDSGSFPAWLDIHNNASTPFRLYLSGTGQAAGLAVSGDGAFGDVLTGGSLSRTFSIANDGTRLLTVSGVTTGGADAASFEVSGVPASVPAGGAGSFTVTFSPASDGAKSTTLTITGDSPDSPIELSLSGRGLTEPRFTLLGINGAVLAKGETPTTAKGGDFGIVPRSTPVEHTFTITNAGNSLLGLSGWTTNGTGAGKFTVAGIPATVAAGAKAQFTATFLDSDGGVFDAQLRVSHDADASPFTLNLMAQGQLPGMSFLTSPVTNATEGELYQYEPEAQDLLAPSAEITYTASNLPAWLSFSEASASYNIDTVAGKSVAQVDGGQTIYTSGFSGDGGQATNADFNLPFAAAAGSAGNLFIADAGNYRIRRVAANSVVTTFAGNGDYAYSGDGGQATDAGIGFPLSVAVDSIGNLFFYANNRIRRVATNGVITTVAGNGYSGNGGIGGPATSATVDAGFGLAVDGAGNLYVNVLSTGHRIMKVTTNGTWEIAAGTGGFNNPPGAGDGQPATSVALGLEGSAGMAADAAGRVYFAETDRIRYIETNGLLRTAVTNMTGIRGMAVGSDGMLYVVRQTGGAAKVFTVDAESNVTHIAGNGMSGLSGDGGPATNASLSSAWYAGLALGGAGQVYVADSTVHRVRELARLPAGLSGTPLPEHVGSVSTVTVHAANSRTNADQTFSISVAGRPQAAIINPLGNVGFSGDGTTVFQSFGTVQTNDTLTLTLAVTNSGTAALTVTGVSTSGSSSFLMQPDSFTVAAGAASNFTVRYAPEALGTEQAVFSIGHNAANSPLNLTADGYGLKPGEMGVDKVSLNFQATYLGANPAVQTVALTNKGDIAYTFTNTAIDVAWLTFTPGTAELAGKSGTVLTGSVDIAGLGGGTHIATNRISSGALNTPVDVIVRLDIAKLDQAITYTPLDDQDITAEIGLSATADSGLAPAFKVMDGPGQIADDTNLTFQNEGYVTLEVTQGGNANYNPAPTITNRFRVSKSAVTITITNVADKTYNGTPVTDVGVETVPADVPCSITFNGFTNAPLDAGVYSVVANSADWRYLGSASATLQIFRAAATVSLTNLSFVYDGTGKTAVATSAPTGLVTEVRYNGSLAAPVNAGSYTTTAAIVEANYTGGATDTLTIAKADQTLAFDPLGEQAATTVTSLTATATSGLSPVFEIASGPAELYAGKDLSFTNSGTVTLLVKQPGDGNWNPAPTLTNTFDVVKLAVAVFIEETNQVYNGVAREVAAYSDPACDLTVTYDGSTNGPVGAGAYTVIATVSDTLYSGAATSVLTIAKADQIIIFPAIAPQKAAASVGLVVSGGDSGNSVLLNITSGPGIIAGGTNLTFTGPGDVVIVASQAGDVNYEPAVNVTNMVKAFSVTPDNGPFAGGNTVVVSNGHFGTITNVVVGETPVLPSSSGTNWFSVVMPAVTNSGVVDITVQTGDDGDTTLPDAYTFNPAGVIATPVAPDSGWVTGGYQVVISGTNLASSDSQNVTNVTLCGYSAGISSFSSTQVVVIAGVAAVPGQGAVRVFSISHGETVASNAFTYFGPVLNVLGTNGAVITNSEPASAAKGTDFGSFAWGTTLTNTLVITNSGNVTLNISAITTNSATPGVFRISPGSMTVPVGGAVECPVVCAVSNAGIFNAEFELASDALASPMRLRVAAVGEKRAQAITFDPIAEQLTTNRLGLAATADSSLNVLFTVSAGPATLSGGTNLSFSSPGSVSIVAAQSGNADWNPAPNVTNTFNVVKAVASVALTNLTHTYNGAAHGAEAVTVPAGLAVNITYDGNAWAPTNSGQYAVTGVVDDVMFQGSATGLLAIAKSAQTISFPAIINQKTTNETAISATASSGLTVEFELVSGPAVLAGASSPSSLTYTNAGTVVIRAVQAGNANYEAAAPVTNSFHVSRVNAGVTLTNLNQTYDGTAREVGFITSPTGLTVNLTYDGNDWAPTNAGSYWVTGTVASAIYDGSAVDLLTVGKADQVIGAFLPADASVFAVSSIQGLSATSSSQLAVGFVVVSGAASISNGTNLAFSGLGAVQVAARQAGDGNYSPAGTTNNYTVIGGIFGAIGADGEPLETGAQPTSARGTDYGMVSSGSVASVMLAITNTGTADLAISGWTTNGAGAAWFTITGMPEIVEVGGISNFWAVYAPAATGLHQATISIASDGLPPIFELRLAAMAIRPGEIGLNASMMSYSATYGGTNPAPATYMITNKGEIAFSYSNAATYGSGEGWFNLQPSTGYLEPGSIQWHTGIVASVAGLDAGTYVATNTITGTATNAPVDILIELIVNQTTQMISFAAITDQIATSTTPVSATASSGLPVSFEVVSGPAVLAGSTSPTTLTYTNAGTVIIRAAQTGDVNYLSAPRVTNTFNVVKAPATVVFTNLSQVYDGAARIAGFRTEPPGLDVLVTYNGGYTPPTEAGSYAVTGVVNEALYQGAQTGTLVVGKAPADVYLVNMTQNWNGEARHATATTMPSGLKVEFTYDGNSWAPTNGGTYAVTGVVDEVNYSGSATGTLTIARLAQTITFPALPNCHEAGSLGLAATASSGLAVSFAAVAPGIVSGETNLTFSGIGDAYVVASQTGNHAYAAAPTVSNLVHVFALSTNSGPYAGGNAVAVSNGNFGVVTNVLVGSLPAVVLASSANSAVIEMPAATNVGAVNITVQTAANGDIVLPSAYSYNPAGRIFYNYDGGWSAAPGLPEARSGMLVAELNGGLYAMGGVNSNNVGQTNVYRFDGEVWSEVSAMPMVMRDAALGLYNGALFMISGVGQNYSLLNNVFRFDGDTWAEVSGVPAARRNAAAVEFDGALYLIGGSDQGASSSNVYVYAGIGWSEAPSLPAPGTRAHAAVLNGVLFAMPGDTNAPERMFAFVGAQWVETNAAPATAVPFGFAAADGVIRAVGCDGAFAARQYDGTSWTAFENFPSNGHANVTGAGMAALDSMLFSVGGVASDEDGGQTVRTYYTNVYRYAVVGSAGVIPDSGSWTGGFQVVISGTNLASSGSPDVTNVTLCGVSAQSVVSVSPTQIVVVAGVASGSGIGDVCVYSVGFGQTMKHSAFTYTREPQAALQFEPASPQAYMSTNALTLGGGSGTGAVSFAVLAGPGAIVSGSNLFISASTGLVTVAASKAQDSRYYEAGITAVVSAAKGNAVVYLSDLSHVYDGTAKSASATTMPAGLVVTFMYDGATSSVPVNAGSYGVEAVAVDAAWQGTASNTLVIAKAGQTIVFPAIADQDLNATVGLAATASSGLEVSFAVDSGPGLISGGTNLSFSGTSTVGIAASQAGNTNWNPAPIVTNSLNVTGSFVDSGFVAVVLNKDEGSWSMVAPAGYTGPTAGTGSLAQTAAATGSYTVSFGHLAGYRRPATQTKEITLSDLTTFAGTYAVGQTPVDFGGEGISDLAVYDPLTGRWYIWSPETGVIAWETPLGGPGFSPIPGDYNGNGRVDFAVYRDGYWYAQGLDGTWILEGEAFGGADFNPVAGDYDGDGITDMMVYHEESGRWFGRTVAGALLMWGTQWGGPGFSPVSGDYNNNGRTDLAVYANGYWFIQTADGEEVILYGIGWGGAEFTPVPGEYDGDGETDLAVYHEQSGMWFIIKLDGTLILWGERWGGPGFKAVTGDYNGDGISDLAVYYNGYWFVKTVDGEVLFYGEQWGAEGFDPVGR